MNPRRLATMITTLLAAASCASAADAVDTISPEAAIIGTWRNHPDPVAGHAPGDFDIFLSFSPDHRLVGHFGCAIAAELERAGLPPETQGHWHFTADGHLVMAADSDGATPAKRVGLRFTKDGLDLVTDDGTSPHLERWTGPVPPPCAAAG
jgi:hypothetical protein